MKSNTLFFFYFLIFCFSCKVITQNTVIKNSNISYKGGSGSSIINAVSITNANSTQQVIDAQHYFIETMLGGKKWIIIEKKYLIEEAIDVLLIQTTKTDSIFNVYFNMNDCKNL